MGHVMLVTAAPRCVHRHSATEDLLEIWPGATGVSEVWLVRTVESTRRESGLYECDAMLYVDRQTRRIMIAGEVSLNDDVSSADAEPVELWQSPEELRSELRMDLMAEVLNEMRASQANWCLATGLKAVFKAATLTAGRCSIKTMEELRLCWERPPICTSVAISFWQRYLEKLAVATVGAQDTKANSGVFLEGERVVYWSADLRQWIDAVITGRNMDLHGRVVSYNLDARCAALPAQIRRPWQVTTSSGRAVELVMKYMPLKADRALPGDLLKVLKECNWVSLPQVPCIFRQGVMPGTQHVALVAPVAPVAPRTAPPSTIVQHPGVAPSIPAAMAASPLEVPSSRTLLEPVPMSGCSEPPAGHLNVSAWEDGEQPASTLGAARALQPPILAFESDCTEPADHEFAAPSEAEPSDLGFPRQETFYEELASLRVRGEVSEVAPPRTPQGAKTRCDGGTADFVAALAAMLSPGLAADIGVSASQRSGAAAESATATRPGCRKRETSLRKAAMLACETDDEDAFLPLVGPL